MGTRGDEAVAPLEVDATGRPVAALGPIRSARSAVDRDQHAALVSGNDREARARQTFRPRAAGRATMMRRITTLFAGGVAALLISTSSSFAGDSEDCAAGAAYGHRDYAAALRLCRSLAEQGDPKAQSALGFMYTNGEGVQKDYDESAKWYRKAAEQGYARAQSALGFMYTMGGYGVQKDYDESLRWYRKAAEQGDAFAQYNLGVIYEVGQGVPQDYVLAHMWFNLAAAHSHADPDAYVAQDYAKMYADMRDAVAAKMTPDQIGEAQKMAREWKPK